MVSGKVWRVRRWMLTVIGALAATAPWCHAQDQPEILAPAEITLLERTYSAGDLLPTSETERLGGIALDAGRSTEDIATIGAAVHTAFDIAALSGCEQGDRLRAGAFELFAITWRDGFEGAELEAAYNIMWRNFRRPRVWMKPPDRRAGEAQLASMCSVLIDQAPSHKARALAEYIDIERTMSRVRDSSLTALGIDERRAAVEHVLRFLAASGSLRRPGSSTVYARIASTYAYEIENLSVGAPLPDVRGFDLSGEPIALADFRGRVVLLSGWATWCAPCLAMFPHEVALMECYADEGFVIVGVNDDAEIAAARATRDEHGLNYRSLWARSADPSATQSLGMSGLPAFILLDRDGRIIARAAGGGDTAHERLEELVLEALGQPGRE